jgi:hypothetical protein
MFLIRVFVINFLFFNLCFCIPQLCEKAKPWSINGRAFVDEYKGKILFLAFLKLDCSICLDIISKSDTFMRTDGMTERFSHDLSIVIVAPSTEHDSRISLMQSKYPGIRIVKESHQEPLWGWLRVGHHDGLIFDRCGRLSKHVRIPRQSIEISNELFNTLRTILTGHTCGFCNYDAASERRLLINFNKPTPTAQVFAPQITAYVVPHPKGTWKSKENGIPQTARNTVTKQNNINGIGNGNGGNGYANGNDANSGNVQFTPIQANYGINGKNSGKIYAQQQQPGVFGEEEEAFTEINPPKNKINGNEKLPITTSSPKPIEPLYSDDAEAASQVPSEYYDYVSEWTTPNPPQNVQIPKPSSPSSTWPTKIPSIKDRIVSPCAGYTDDICYQQVCFYANFTMI